MMLQSCLIAQWIRIGVRSFAKAANQTLLSSEIVVASVLVLFQRELPGAVIRRIETIIPTFEQLKLPLVLQDLAIAKRGLVLVVGATGSGKSTTMAAMTGYRNSNKTGHILTVEDPIEFVHEHKRCIVTQREVGLDTESYEVALKTRCAKRQI